MPNFGTKKQKQRTKKSAKATSAQASSSKDPFMTWVDRLIFVPVVREALKDDDAAAANDDETMAAAAAANDALNEVNEWITVSVNANEKTKSRRDSLSVVSWNMLAESYCTPKSQSNLPREYRSQVFDPKRRRKLLFKTLQKFVIRNDESKTSDSITDINNSAAAAHVICLQEVDLSDVAQYLERHDYIGIETPRTKGGGAGGRADACTCFVYQKEWEIVTHELVRLDDLATLGVRNTATRMNDSANDGTSPSATNKSNGQSSNNNHNNSNQLEGLQQTLLRRNVALLVRIRSKRNPLRTVVIATAHLYWHPGYEYVKLCQAHYVLVRAKAFLNSLDESFIFCGDFNSRPHGAAHSYLTKGVINAKLVAPWYHQVPVGEAALSHACDRNSYDERGADDEDGGGSDSSKQQQQNVDALTERLTRELSIYDDDSPDNPQRRQVTVRYCLDNTLNKLCRWLRILGQDAALETDVEERLRTQQAVYSIFDRCKEERRTLVTTSRRMLSRRDCPPGAYCLSPKLLNNLEVALVHLLLTHGVMLEPTKFLSRCVVCNESIVEVHDASEKKRILDSYDAPSNLVDDHMEVYECDGCRQGYWWCDQPTSSASRVKSAASNMFQLCLRAGVPCADDLGMFDFVNVKAERVQGWDASRPASEVLEQQLMVVDWLKDERLACPIQLTSAYSQHDKSSKNGLTESIPFTNVTDTFVNVLDYIFYNASLTVVEKLSIPTSFAELNSNSIPQGHLLPSDIWPSDHLAIGARFVFVD
ncbi:hypothetical protein MPSEU_000512000 [Mayamaea pseudoterrestris]|nr:hypothetical protein MPSEU_000512000 [Mayamaea pseudoterrestris]